MRNWTIRAARAGDPRSIGSRLFATARPPAWTEHAACLDTDPDLWFPDKGSNLGIIAKSICRRCPVRRECLAYALETETRAFGTESSYPSGIYGGLTAQERAALRKERRDAS